MKHEWKIIGGLAIILILNVIVVNLPKKERLQDVRVKHYRELHKQDSIRYVNNVK